MTAGSITVFSNGDRKMTATGEFDAGKRLEAISSLVPRVYGAMAEEVPRERSRVSGGNSSNVEEELSRNSNSPCCCSTAAAQQPPSCNPRVNYGMVVVERKGDKHQVPGKESQLKKVRIASLTISSLFIDNETAALR